MKFTIKVWDLTSFKMKIVSGSWDFTIKVCHFLILKKKDKILDLILLNNIYLAAYIKMVQSLFGIYIQLKRFHMC